mmetsp:Transcript_122889/g.225423  ORF Transcript_122889/g.225423 Transcript_122889/m.225423 type:complete len:106 (-) Transcript_122889:4-321(-)
MKPIIPTMATRTNACWEKPGRSSPALRRVPNRTALRATLRTRRTLTLLGITNGERLQQQQRQKQQLVAANCPAGQSKSAGCANAPASTRNVDVGAHCKTNLRQNP